MPSPFAFKCIRSRLANLRPFAFNVAENFQSECVCAHRKAMTWFSNAKTEIDGKQRELARRWDAFRGPSSLAAESARAAVRSVINRSDASVFADEPPTAQASPISIDVDHNVADARAAFTTTAAIAADSVTADSVTATTSLRRAPDDVAIALTDGLRANATVDLKRTYVQTAPSGGRAQNAYISRRADTGGGMAQTAQ